jgi:hypothetical protein
MDRTKIRHNECAVNILEGAISGKRAVARPRLHYIKQFAKTHELTVTQLWKEWLATIPEGKLPTNHKIER